MAAARPHHVNGSSRARLAARRRAERRRGPATDDLFGVRLACTVSADADEIELAKKASHDALIEAMGSRRRGGVEWLIVEEPGPRDRIVADMAANPGMVEQALEGVAASFGSVIEWFRDHPSGVLVIAIAPGDPA